MNYKVLFLYILVISFSFISCATTNNTVKIPRENKRLEYVMKKEYAGYDEMVERGFNLHELDFISSKQEFMDIYLKYYYDEQGYPLDNHISIYNVPSYRKITTTQFTTEYGTKEELELKGYKENETMFYFPSNGEKNWRVGKIGFDVGKITSTKTSKKYEYYETKKSIYYRLPTFAGEMGDIPFVKGTNEKENIIFDLRSNTGGHLTWANNFFKKLGNYNGKILILYDNTSASAAECFFFLAKCNPDLIYGFANNYLTFTISNYNIYLIGTNTYGCAKYGFEGLDGHPCDFSFESLYLDMFLPDAKVFERITKHDYDYGKEFIEGRGLLPDAWAITEDEYLKTIQLYTGDEEIDKLL